MDTDVAVIRKPKSAVLTKDERIALKEYRKRFLTKYACAISLGTSYQVLDRVMQLGQGAPETIDKIRSVIGVNG